MERGTSSRTKSIANPFAHSTKRPIAWALLTLALTLVATVGIVHAGGGAASEPENALPAPQGTTHRTDVRSEANADFDTVWTTVLIVGKASDSTVTYMGYMPTLYPNAGDLAIREFTYQGVTYTVQALFQQDFAGSVRQLVLSADQPLPDELFLQTGDSLFPVSEARALGTDGNIHAWWLDNLLDWDEGDAVPVSLLKVPDPTFEEIPPEEPPVPIMLAVYDTTDELTESGQFDTFRVRLEAGRIYVVDVKGSATGDGTLPDPWISGIKDRFEVNGQPDWQPVWYDPLGRTSTAVRFPDGADYVVDENGRMFSAVTRGDGSMAQLPVTGDNDDGGEGFNARLYLSNFPSGEYQIVVSGAPNPVDVGTYTFSLMEVMSDDHAAARDGAGTVEPRGAVMGYIERPGDVDWFAVALDRGVEYRIDLGGSHSADGTLAEPRFAGIFDAELALLDDTQNNHEDSGSVNASRIEFTPQSSGTYHIAVSGYTPYIPSRSVIPVGTYTLTVTPVE